MIDLRVLDRTTGIAGAYCSKVLAAKKAGHFAGLWLLAALSEIGLHMMRILKTSAKLPSFFWLPFVSATHTVSPGRSGL